MFKSKNIKGFVKAFSHHIAILALLAIPIYFHFDGKQADILETERTLAKKELDLKTKELELTHSLNENNRFFIALEKFLSEYSDVDLSKEIQCDEAYMSRYREAEAHLNALEGMALELSKISSYRNFFREQRGYIHQIVGSCDGNAA